MAHEKGKKRYKNSKLVNYRIEMAKKLFEEKAYVCPKCKCVFDEKDYKVIKLQTNIKFQCLNCKKEFYKQKVSKDNLLRIEKKSYTITAKISSLSKKELQEKAQDKLKGFVLNLYCQGFLKSEIVNITQIPPYLVQKYKKTLPQKEETLNVKDFFKTILDVDISIEDIEQFHDIPTDQKYDLIFKAIDLGFPYEFTTNVLKISKSTLANITKIYYDHLSEEDIKKILANQFKYKYEYFEGDEEIKINIRTYYCK